MAWRRVPKGVHLETRGIFRGLPLLVAAPWITSRAYHVAVMGTEDVRFLVLWMAGWISQLEVIDLLSEENSVLRE